MLLLSRSLRCAIFVAREAARIFTTTVDIEEDLRRIALQEDACSSIALAPPPPGISEST